MKKLTIIAIAALTTGVTAVSIAVKSNHDCDGGKLSAYKSDFAIKTFSGDKSDVATIE